MTEIDEDESSPPFTDWVGMAAGLRSVQSTARREAIGNYLAVASVDPLGVAAVLGEILRRNDPWSGETEENRIAAANGLREIATTPIPDKIQQSVVPALLDALWDPSEAVRQAAAVALRHVHPAKGSSSSALHHIPLLQDRYDLPKLPGLIDGQPILGGDPVFIIYDWWQAGCDPRIGRLLAGQMVLHLAGKPELLDDREFRQRLLDLAGLPDLEKTHPDGPGQRWQGPLLFFILIRLWGVTREAGAVSVVLANHLATHYTSVNRSMRMIDDMRPTIRESLSEGDVPFLAAWLCPLNPLVVRLAAAVWLGELPAGPNAAAALLLLVRQLCTEGDHAIETRLRTSVARAIIRWGMNSLPALPALRRMAPPRGAALGQSGSTGRLVRLAAWAVEEFSCVRAGTSDPSDRLRVGPSKLQWEWMDGAEEWIVTADSSMDSEEIGVEALTPVWLAAAARARRWIGRLHPYSISSGSYFVKMPEEVGERLHGLCLRLRDVVKRLESRLKEEG